jgi:xanthine dehydrogenase accessory factor
VEVIDAESAVGDFPEASRVSARASPDAIPLGASVLVATMDERDIDAIEAARALEPAYLGVIASRKRFAQLRDALAARGIPHSVLDAIRAPAGLDIGARTPEEIAISVMAEIVQARRASPAAAATGRAPERRESLDPVCGMTVAIAGARHSAEVDGRQYYFCCDGCRTAFLANPARYERALRT